MGYTFDIFTTCYGKLFCSCLWPLACALLIFSGQNIGTFTILMPSVFLPLPFSCMSGNSQLYRYWFCKQGGHLRNCGILSYPVLPPSSSPPFFHQFFHHFFPPFFPTCLFEVKISKRTFSFFFSPSRGDQVKNKKPLGEKTGPRFFTIHGGPGEQDSSRKIDGVNFSPRKFSPRAKFHNPWGKISPAISPPNSPQESQNFASSLTSFFTTRFTTRFRHKIHHKLHHKLARRLATRFRYKIRKIAGKASGGLWRLMPAHGC